MAGLCGVIALCDGVDVVELNRRLVSRLRHRGPDGVHEWSAPGISMSHLVLQTQPGTAATPQPLRLADGRIFLVDGYVANPSALTNGLQGQAESPQATDAQLLAWAFETWGLDFWRHVEGDFAVAVWDPASRALLLVRDRLGVRPLFHVRTRALVAFCSEGEPLFALPGVVGRIRDATVAAVWTQLQFPRAEWTDREGTLSALPPAHRVHVDRHGSMVAERYWRLAPRAELHLPDERAYVEAFQETFGRAVASATRGVETSALMLSGGIDSGAILAAGRGFRKDGRAPGLLCISAVTDERTPGHGYADETANIRALTAGEAAPIHFTVPIQADTGDAVEAADAAEVAWSYLYPVDASVYIPSLVGRIARNNGMKVVLTGAMGDLVNASPLNYAGQLALRGRWRDAIREAREASRVHTYLKGRSPAHILARGTLGETQPAAVRRWRAKRRIASEIQYLDASGLSAAFLQHADIKARYLAGLEKRLKTLPHSPGERRCIALAEGLEAGLQGLDRAISRQGVEARDPWATLQVVEFFLSLPVEWQARLGWTKYLVRRACEDALGPEVAWHSGKGHHGPLVTRQLVVDAAPFLRQYLHARRPTLARYFEEGLLGKLDAALSKPHEMGYETADEVNAMVALAGWLQRQGSEQEV